jgi:hypothetical protein
MVCFLFLCSLVCFLCFKLGVSAFPAASAILMVGEEDAVSAFRAVFALSDDLIAFDFEYFSFFHALFLLRWFFRGGFFLDFAFLCSFLLCFLFCT